MRRSSPFLCLTIAAGAVQVGAAQAKEPGIAFVLANSAYKIGKLSHTLEDASVLERDLRERLGYEVVTLKDGTTDTMRRQIEQLRSESSKAAHVVVYFGGYAVNANGQNYLLGVDSNGATSGEALPLSEVTKAIDPKAKSVTLILDASYKPAEFRAASGVKPGLTAIKESPRDGFVIISAQQPDRLATPPDQGGGTLTRAVTATLADDQSGRSTLGRWFDFVRDLVVDETRSEQEPHLVASLESRRVRLAALAPDARGGTGPVTRSDAPPAISAAPRAPEPAAPEPSEKELARALQQRLARYACYAGADDGNWGPKSQAALKEFIKTAKADPEAGRKLRDGGIDLDLLESRAESPREVYAFFGKFEFDFRCPFAPTAPTAKTVEEDDGKSAAKSKPKVAARRDDDDDDRPAARASRGSSGSGSPSAPSRSPSAPARSGGTPNVNW